ncbi:hypothetical protein [Helicobacter acinonychis]|uniref:Periplasmic protein n=1 Tax=Helicobacter acinonychis (strain Sheeba) TaxID=382638 RepID=Q17Z96_HELAH|nr:hypothetical protein [Helicobacter acinonychis]CAJ99030.1 conserved hypothetical protein [Helicobacter acinonychis str. Sheeba]
MACWCKRLAVSCCIFLLSCVMNAHNVELVRNDPPLDSELPTWVYSIALLKVYFSDGTYKEGYATLLENGHYIASSETLYSNGLYPKTILAKMQDSSAKELICIASLHLEAIDRDQGLSLLKTADFRDDYCHKREESYYHARIYTKYAQTFYSNPYINKKTSDSDLYYPALNEGNSFSIQTMGISVAELLKSKKFLSLDSSFKKGSVLWGGRPYFSEMGEFMGMASSVLGDQENLVIIPREKIVQFLNTLKNQNIFQNIP